MMTVQCYSNCRIVAASPHDHVATTGTLPVSIHTKRILALRAILHQCNTLDTSAVRYPRTYAHTRPILYGTGLALTAAAAKVPAFLALVVSVAVRQADVPVTGASGSAGLTRIPKTVPVSARVVVKDGMPRRRVAYGEVSPCERSGVRRSEWASP
jgi:hypothetical protein